MAEDWIRTKFQNYSITWDGGANLEEELIGQKGAREEFSPGSFHRFGYGLLRQALTGYDWQMLGGDRPPRDLHLTAPKRVHTGSPRQQGDSALYSEFCEVIGVR